MGTKISIIGAGSAVFSLSTIRDICLTSNLQGSTVTFMDVDDERLDAAYRLCQRYAEEIGIELALHKTTDRREALQGAEFVVNTALVSGHRAMQEGWEIARKHGYRFGGSYHITHDEAFWINFYQFRFFEEVIGDMSEICPDAWHLLVANPVLAGVTFLSRKYPQHKLVGLCHGYSGVYHLASVLGLDRDRITFEIPGVNHFVWLTHLYHDGKDAMPLLDHWIENKAPKYWETCGTSTGMGPKAVDLYKRFGAFPIGDTGNPGGGTWPWWYHVNDETERHWKEDPTVWWHGDRGYFRQTAAQVAEIAQIAAGETAKVTDHYPPRLSGESIVQIIESIACDVPRVFIVNVPNIGDFVPGVPRDFEVEIPALVSKRGIQGIRTNGLPPALISYILHDRVAPVNIELEAYETGSQQLLLQLILMDPWTHSEQQARDLLEDIMALPYHQEMHEHYR
jgi:alpha-galactosidase